MIPAGDTSKQAAVIWKYTQPGKLNLVKSSSVKGYKKTFAGCEYTVYKSDKKTAVGKLTCKADGSTNILSLQPGTYYVKETKAPKGFAVNASSYAVEVTANGTPQVNGEGGVADIPQTNEIELFALKRDAETADGTAQGSATVRTEREAP